MCHEQTHLVSEVAIQTAYYSTCFCLPALRRDSNRWTQPGTIPPIFGLLWLQIWMLTRNKPSFYTKRTDLPYWCTDILDCIHCGRPFLPVILQYTPMSWPSLVDPHPTRRLPEANRSWEDQNLQALPSLVSIRRTVFENDEYSFHCSFQRGHKGGTHEALRQSQRACHTKTRSRKDVRVSEAQWGLIELLEVKYFHHRFNLADFARTSQPLLPDVEHIRSCFSTLEISLRSTADIAAFMQLETALNYIHEFAKSAKIMRFDWGSCLRLYCKCTDEDVNGP